MSSALIDKDVPATRQTVDDGHSVASSEEMLLAKLGYRQVSHWCVLVARSPIADDHIFVVQEFKREFTNLSVSVLQSLAWTDPSN